MACKVRQSTRHLLDRFVPMHLVVEASRSSSRTDRSTSVATNDTAACRRLEDATVEEGSQVWAVEENGLEQIRPNIG